ncbi:Type IV secretion system protein virB10 [Rickettsiales endosymbiont of Trichoplax sp. H2]|nr:Type IV secretion system protein virB10 [Rickettsiales endosymbiont of Trichoplax sp. H2]
MLRAIVSRDIYAEQGTDVMIPKGSRLIGTYTSQVKGGQTRVGVIWNRLIRPDGLDIEIKSQGVDQLGRPGVAGNIYDHFWRKIGNAFLVSYVVPVAAAEAAKKASNIKNSSSSSTTNKGTDGSITITTTGDPVSQAITDSTKQFSDITKSMIQDSFSTNPTITVNQGTIINILVQRDLVFPPPSLLQNRKLNNK